MIPLVALVWMLGSGVPVANTAFYTILITIAVSWLRKSTRMGLKDIIIALEEGTRQSLSTIVACGVVGIIIAVVNLTSFGSTLTAAITQVGAGSLFLTLFLTMIASIILGMGLPSIPAYIITATMAAPALAEFGLPILVAHLKTHLAQPLWACFVWAAYRRAPLLRKNRRRMLRSVRIKEIITRAKAQRSVRE